MNREEYKKYLNTQVLSQYWDAVCYWYDTTKMAEDIINTLDVVEEDEEGVFEFVTDYCIEKGLKIN